MKSTATSEGEPFSRAVYWWAIGFYAVIATLSAFGTAGHAPVLLLLFIWPQSIEYLLIHYLASSEWEWALAVVLPIGGVAVLAATYLLRKLKQGFGSVHPVIAGLSICCLALLASSGVAWLVRTIWLALV